MWAVPAFLAGVAWLPQLGRSDHPADPSPEAPWGQRPVAFAPGLAGDAVHGLAVAGVLRDADVAIRRSCRRRGWVWPGRGGCSGSLGPWRS